jgi:Domain of unknown function (DUF4402)
VKIVSLIKTNYMNNFFKMAACTFLVCGTAISAFAQGSASATATSSATIVTPIAIVKASNLDFGNVAISALNLGTVTMPATLAGIRVASGGVTLPVVDGTHQAASFTVSGDGDYAYTVTLPSSSVEIEDGLNVMQVSGLNVSADAGLLAAGTQTIYVGGVLNVAAAQPAGDYLSTTPFTVIVDYN